MLDYIGKKIENFFKWLIDLIVVGGLALFALWIILKLLGYSSFFTKVLSLLEYGKFIGNFLGYIIAGLAVFLLWPFYLLKIYLAKWSKLNSSKGQKKISAAEDFARQIVSSKEEYCLILRPFGNDSYFSIDNIQGEYMSESLLLNWTKDIVLEQVIENLVLEKTGCRTVALVDPNLTFVPSSPLFISAKHETWKYVVFDLIKRSLFTFIILPPKQKVRDSLIWEVTKLVQLGMIGRFMIIIPVQSLSDNSNTIKEIKEKLFFLSDSIDQINKATYLYYPNMELKVTFYYNKWHELEEKERKKHREKLPLHMYEPGISKVLDDMLDNVNGFSFAEKYLYVMRDYEEFDYTMTQDNLELFLKNWKNPFNDK